MTMKYVTNEEVSSGLIQIIRQINVDKWQPSNILGMSRGGIPLAVMLSHYFDVPMKVHNKGENLWLYYGEDTLVIDDINDTGAQLSELTKVFSEDERRWFRIATLFNNQGSYFNGVHYSGIMIDKRKDNSWIVFPWEHWWNA